MEKEKKRRGKRKRSGKEKAMIILAVVTILFSVMSLAAFRGIVYLSDATYLIAKRPYIFIAAAFLLTGANAWLCIKKKTRKRIALTSLSALALISLIINIAVFAGKVRKVEPEIVGAVEGNPAVMDGKTFMAGAAKGNITPLDYMMPMPLLFILKFDRVLDPVYARALALSDGKEEALFITLDMTLVPEADDLLDSLSDQTGIPRENIFVSATHTHGVTPLSLVNFGGIGGMKKREWYSQIKATLIRTVQVARSNMVPAKIGYGTGFSEVNVNRDLDGYPSVLGSNFDRPSDKTIRMVRFDSLDGDTIALVVNYACHSVVMNGALHAGLRTYWTGDLAGNTSTKLEKQMGGAVALYSCGAAGDQNPALRAQYGGPTGKGNPAVKNLGRASINVLEYLSEIHSRDILRANDQIVCTETEGKIYAKQKTVQVELNNPGDTIEYTLRLFGLGNIMVQGIDAEIVTSVGQAIVNASPYDNTILVTLANGYKGYCPDDWEVDHKAFEWNESIKKGAAQKAFLEGFAQIFSQLGD